ncbi:MAG TPA: hypothetical protein VFD92_16270 [Candidatus Binatia bacterium]|nr:hypothetical protein [Candidatus Binatia bacterium]
MVDLALVLRRRDAREEADESHHDATAVLIVENVFTTIPFYEAHAPRTRARVVSAPNGADACTSDVTRVQQWCLEAVDEMTLEDARRGAAQRRRSLLAHARGSSARRFAARLDTRRLFFFAGLD